MHEQVESPFSFNLLICHIMNMNIEVRAAHLPDMINWPQTCTFFIQRRHTFVTIVTVDALRIIMGCSDIIEYPYLPRCARPKIYADIILYYYNF